MGKRDDSPGSRGATPVLLAVDGQGCCASPPSATPLREDSVDASRVCIGRATGR
ncbi:hypothetical protein MJ561_07435 [Klebsiella pneumoniae]|nr:hypothetical protein MJ561_07435 [Klebsiella pneumoniae]